MLAAKKPKLLRRNKANKEDRMKAYDLMDRLRTSEPGSKARLVAMNEVVELFTFKRETEDISRNSKIKVDPIKFAMVKKALYEKDGKAPATEIGRRMGISQRIISSYIKEQMRADQLKFDDYTALAWIELDLKLAPCTLLVHYFASALDGVQALAEKSGVEEIKIRASIDRLPTKFHARFINKDSNEILGPERNQELNNIFRLLEKYRD